MNLAIQTIPRFKEFAPGEKPNVVDPISARQRSAWKEIPDVLDRSCDVVVAGGGLSGVAAAIAATRRGASVIMVEPTHMVGGQATAGGVSAFDITFHYDHALNDFGIWSEILARIQHIYDVEFNRPVNVGHYRKISFTPNVVVVERVLTEMLDAAGIPVLRNTGISAAFREAGRVTGLLTTAGPIEAKVVIDATEDGQVLALAGVPHRLSNGVSNGTSTRGITSKRQAIQDITYTAIIQAYPGGIPDELRVTVAPEHYDTYATEFRSAYPPEGGFDRLKKKPGPLGFAGFRAAPDLSSENMQTGDDYNAVTRTNLNHYNDFPVGADYLTDPDARARYEAEAKLKTICIIYYLQNELGLPWSVATDEGYADGPTPPRNPYVPDIYIPIEQHMPLIPYIRESRRVIGTAIITGKDINREPNRTEARWRDDSVVVGTYHPDLHGGRAETDFENYLGESLADKPTVWREGPFPIPLGALVPEWVDGLLAAEKNISTTRLASGAVRLHPTVTGIGEAAGTAAALAVHHGVQPTEIPVAAVQLSLAEGGALLTPLAVEGLDRGSPEFIAVTLALARNRADKEILRPKKMEPYIITDTEAAAAAGQVSIQYLKDWRVSIQR